MAHPLHGTYRLLIICCAIVATGSISSCKIFGFAPYTRKEKTLKPGDSVVLINLAARRLGLMDMAYIQEESYKFTQQFIPAFKNALTEARITYTPGVSQLDTTGDLLYEALRRLRRKNSDTLLLSLLKRNLKPGKAPVLLFLAAATPPNPYRDAGGFYGSSYAIDKDKGSVQIRLFAVVYSNNTIQYSDALKFGGMYRPVTRKKKKAEKYCNRLVKNLVKVE